MQHLAYDVGAYNSFLLFWGSNFNCISILYWAFWWTVYLCPWCCSAVILTFIISAERVTFLIISYFRLWRRTCLLACNVSYVFVWLLNSPMDFMVLVCVCVWTCDGQSLNPTLGRAGLMILSVQLTTRTHPCQIHKTIWEDIHWFSKVEALLSYFTLKTAIPIFFYKYYLEFSEC